MTPCAAREGGEIMRTQQALVTVATLVLGCLLHLSQAMAEPVSFQSLQGGVKARDLTVGQGQRAESGMVATINVIGWLDEGGARGKQLYNTHRDGRPISFVVGTDKVMPAWNVGVEGMQVGSRRMLLVPPGMAYGKRSVDKLIPADSPLMLQIELVGLEAAPE
jgi:FKBP-type peptidyl-prolyl cis-trans isomerase FkpA